MVVATGIAIIFIPLFFRVIESAAERGATAPPRDVEAAGGQRGAALRASPPSGP